MKSVPGLSISWPEQEEGLTLLVCGLMERERLEDVTLGIKKLKGWR